MAEEETRMYRDVIRIETSNTDGAGSLGALLRQKQLGFLRTQVNGVEVVKMGYKDSTNRVHYFTKDTELSSEYWQSSANGIHYNGGRVAVGRIPDASPFEVRSSGANLQIRTSFSGDSFADTGVDGGGTYRVRVCGTERISLSTANFNINTSNSTLEYNDTQNSGTGELFINTRKNGSNIKIKNSGSTGNIILDAGGGGGGVLFQQSSGSVSKLSYSTSGEILFEMMRSGNFRLKNSNSNIILEPRGNGGAVELAFNGSCAGRISFSNSFAYSRGEMLINVDNSLNDLRLKAGSNHNVDKTKYGNGSIILELGSPDSSLVLASSVCNCIGKFNYSTGNKEAQFEVVEDCDLRIKNNSGMDNNNDIILQPGTNGGGIVFSSGTVSVLKISSSLNMSNYREVLFDIIDGSCSNDLRFRNGSGNVILEAPGTDIRHNGAAVQIKSNYLQLPVKTTSGHLSTLNNDIYDGYMYVNKADENVYLYIDGGWKTLYTWKNS